MVEKKAHKADIITTFGERLEDLRRDHNMTQAELADVLKISKGTLQNYETNNYKDLSFSVVKSIADLFDVSMDYLAGRKVSKETPDTPVEALMLTDEAIEAISKGNYDHVLLSEILSHEAFMRLMLDVTVYVSQSHALSMVQNNAALSYARELLLLSTGGIDTAETRAMELSSVNEDRFVLEAIHNDIDSILKDLLEAHRPENIDDLKEQAKAEMLDQMTQALDSSSDSNAGSPEQLMDILLGQLQIPADKMSDDQRQTVLDIIKLSPLLKSNISQRGKK